MMNKMLSRPEIKAELKAAGMDYIIDDSIPPFHTEFAQAGK